MTQNMIYQKPATSSIIFLLVALHFLPGDLQAQGDSLLLPFESEDRFGFRSLSKVEINPQYQDAKRFNEGFAAVKKNGQWGYIDNNNHVVIGFKYSDAQNVSNGTALVTFKGSKQFLKIIKHSSGQISIDSITTVTNTVSNQNAYIFDAIAFNQNIAGVRTFGGWQLIRKNGSLLTTSVYQNVGLASEGLIPVQNHLKWGYVNPLGEFVISNKFLNAQPFSYGLAPVQPENPIATNLPIYIFINKAGKQAFEETYAGASSFSDGLAAVKSKKENLWGYINQSGHWVIPPIFENAFPFHQGVAEIIENATNYCFYIDIKGNVLFKKFSKPQKGYGGLEPIKVNVSTVPEGADIFFVPSTVKSLIPNIYHEPNKLILYHAIQKSSFKEYSINQKSYYILARWPDGTIKDTFYKADQANKDIQLTK